MAPLSTLASGGGGPRPDGPKDVVGLKVLLVLLAGAVVAGGCIGLLYSPVFRVRNVIVIGNAHIPRAQVLAAAGMATTDGAVLMVDAGPAKARQALDALPWVAQATFERRWPWTLVIKLEERSPVARIVSGTAEDIVDKSGRVLAVSPSASEAGACFAGDHGGAGRSAGCVRVARDRPQWP